MDDIRKKIIIIICAILGLIVAAMLVIKFYNQPKVNVAPNGNEQTVGETTGVVLGGDGATAQGQTAVPTIQAKPKSTLPSTEVYVKQLAEVFVERFFSYSNQNNNSHIDDAVEMSTAAMIKWINTQTQTMSADYQGVTTQVISSSVRAITAEKAVVGVEVQQVFEGSKSDTKSRIGKAELVKVGNDWKIDGFFWE